MTTRRNPAPDASVWTEIVETKKLERSDRVRGGARTIVWRLEWIDAGLDVKRDHLAIAYVISRGLSGLIFNERMLNTKFARMPAVLLASEGSGSEWSFRNWQADFDVYLTDRAPWIDEDGMKSVGMDGYFILQKMMDRLHEIEAALPRPKKRARR